MAKLSGTEPSHVCVSSETGFSHAEIRAATLKLNKEPNVCLRDTESIVCVALDGHWLYTECSRTAETMDLVSLHQQNKTNLLNKYAFVLSTHDTLDLFTSPVSCIVVYIGSILVQMKPLKSVIWNTT